MDSQQVDEEEKCARHFPSDTKSLSEVAEAGLFRPLDLLDILIDYELPIDVSSLQSLEQWISQESFRRSLLASVQPFSSQSSGEHRRIHTKFLKDSISCPGRLTDISGECSSGKTHLIYALVRDVLVNEPEANIVILCVYHPFNLDRLICLNLGIPSPEWMRRLRIADKVETLDDLCSLIHTLWVGTSVGARYLLIDDISLVHFASKRQLLEFYLSEIRSLLQARYAVIQTSGFTSRALYGDDSFEETAEVGQLLPPSQVYLSGKPWLDATLRHGYVDILCVLKGGIGMTESSCAPDFLSPDRELHILKSAGVATVAHRFSFWITETGVHYHMIGGNGQQGAHLPPSTSEQSTSANAL